MWKEGSPRSLSASSRLPFRIPFRGLFRGPFRIVSIGYDRSDGLDGDRLDGGDQRVVVVEDGTAGQAGRIHWKQGHDGDDGRDGG